MTQDDKDELWAAYAKGVRKLDEKPEEKKPRKEKPAQKPLPENKPKQPIESASKQELPPDMPAAWQKIVAGEEPKPESAPEEKKQEEPAPKQEAASAPQPVWKREPLDLRIERNLSLGDVVIEAKLDLHGKTEEQAHDGLLAFIEKQQTAGRRLVLVITGKGRDGASALRTNVPRWCDAPPLFEKILAVRVAASHHGGEGAYYVLIRKK